MNLLSSGANPLDKIGNLTDNGCEQQGISAKARFHGNPLPHSFEKETNMNIVLSPDPMLRQVCEPCRVEDKSIKKLAKQMAKAMYKNNGWRSRRTPGRRSQTRGRGRL